MKLKNYIRELHAVAKATADGDETVLITGSGKIKQDTIFERTKGLGKSLMAKMFGGSYELKKISCEEGKKEIANKLLAQYIFLSGGENINGQDKLKLESDAESFVNLAITNQFFLKNPQNQFLTFLTQKASINTYPAQTLLQTVFGNLKCAYQYSEKENLFKIKSQLLDEKFEKLSKENNGASKVAIDGKDLIRIDLLAGEADTLMKSRGESRGDAITLAKIIHRPELKDIPDPDIKYQIAKTFADHHLRKDQAEMNKTEFTKNLNNAKKVIQIKISSEACRRYLKEKNITGNRSRLATLMALLLVDKGSSNDKSNISDVFGRAWHAANSKEATQFCNAIRRDIFDENVAKNLLKDFKNTDHANFQR